MYTNDKTHRITLRLNDAQFEHVRSNADILGVSPSEFLRMVINTTMVASKQAEARIEKEVRRTVGRENDKADINDKL